MCLSMPTLSSWSICAKQSVKLKVIYSPEERGWETLDAVWSSQIFFPTQNLGKAYKVDKESEVIL